MQLTRLPLYPFLLGIFPALAYFTQNRYELESYELVRPLLVSLLVTLAAFGVSYLAARKRDAAMLLSLILLILIFLYPHVFEAITLWISPSIRQRYFLLIWCVLGVAAYLLALRKLRNVGHLERPNQCLNLFAIILCGMQLLTVAAWLADGQSSSARHTQWADELVRQMDASDRPGTERDLPDIYFLILDGYARADILKTRFGFDNQEFLDELHRIGFFVADQSHSNYAWTHLSLSATFNCQYLHDLLPANLATGAPRGKRKCYQYFVSKLGKGYIQSNRIQQFLKKLGYDWHTNHTGYAVTQQRDSSFSDVFFGPLTRFEQMLIGKNIFQPFVWWIRSADTSSRNVLRRSQLEAFAELSNLKKPKFAFFHIISPHAPFCFDENGGDVAPHPIYHLSGWLKDNRAVPGYDEYYRENYPKNVAGLNMYAIQCVQSLLDKTEGEAVIVVQSDHGSHLGLYPHDPARTDLPERFGILNAIYLPEEYSREGLDASMSSINTFRVILSNVFGVNLEKLEDRAWFSSGDLEFTEVTENIR